MSDSCSPVDCSPPVSSVHGISQARILEWVAVCFSVGLAAKGDFDHSGAHFLVRRKSFCAVGGYEGRSPQPAHRCTTVMPELRRISEMDTLVLQEPRFPSVQNSLISVYKIQYTKTSLLCNCFSSLCCLLSLITSSYIV